MTRNSSKNDGGPAAEDTYHTIRRQILDGNLDEGRWLRETELARELDVSRTPVRESLRRLAAEGLVLYQPNRGMQVQSWSVVDLAEIYELRTLLEPFGCRLAARTGTADIDRLDALANEMDRVAARDEPDVARLTDLNNRFHAIVLAASGNARLQSLVTSVVQVPLVSRTYSLYSTQDLKRSLAHHHEIVQALHVQDPYWAEAVMRSHIRAAWSALRDKTLSQDPN